MIGDMGDHPMSMPCAGEDHGVVVEIPCPKWIISDTHLSHPPMLGWYPWRCRSRGLEPPPVDARGRPSPTPADVAAHDRHLAESWRSVVGPRDVVLHLGDVAWGKVACDRWLRRLTGVVHVVQGNHDDVADLTGWAASVSRAARFTLPDGRRVLCRHAPAAFTAADAAEYDLLFHGHVHGRPIDQPMHGEPAIAPEISAKARDCSMDRWLRWGPVGVDEVVRGIVPVIDILRLDPDRVGRLKRSGKTDEQILDEAMMRLDRLEGREP